METVTCLGNLDRDPVNTDRIDNKSIENFRSHCYPIISDTDSFFRFPVVPHAEISGFFDHHGTYPGDYSDGYVTFYNGRQSTPGNGFLFTCPNVGNGWVGCEVPASSEADCPDYQELWYDAHHGTDFEYAANWRTGSVCNRSQFTGITRPVYAPAPGKVQLVQLNHPYNGNAVFIKHDIDRDGNYDDDKIRSAYLHFESLAPDIQVGAVIYEGQYLGLGGMTGLAWTPHLHFEVQRAHDVNFQDKWPVDPFGWTGPGEDPWPYANYPLWRYEIALPLILRNYAVCTEGGELIQNGDFETGPPAAPWIQFSNAGNELVSDYLPHSGTWGVWLGGFNNAYEEIHQNFVVPENTSSLTVSFYVVMGSDDSPSIVRDRFYARLQNEAGQTILTLVEMDNTDEEWVWWHWIVHVDNAGALTGQSVRLSFLATNDGNGQATSFWLDDVSITVTCGPGVGNLSVGSTTYQREGNVAPRSVSKPSTEPSNAYPAP